MDHFPKNIKGSNLRENYFRRTVMLSERPKRAITRIFSDTGYELFINGRFSVSVSEWANTRDYDLTVFFQAGRNLIAVRAMNASGHRGFAFELAIDGQSVLFSDGSWKSFPEERWDWMMPSMDDSAWEHADEMDMSAAGGPQWWTPAGSDPTRIIPTLDCSPFFSGPLPKGMDSPFYHASSEAFVPSPELLSVAGEEYACHLREPLPDRQAAAGLVEFKNMDGEIHETNGQVFIAGTGRFSGPSLIVDFGEEVVGYFRVRLQSSAPVSFRLYHGENMTEAAGEIARSEVQHRMLCETYRQEAGIQEFESRMRFGGRFMRMEFFDCQAPVTADGFAIRWSLYPVARKGYWSCDDALLNCIWQCGQKTLHLCMQEYYLDAVKRDRMLWVGDTRAQALCNYVLFGDTRLFEFCWDEIARTQYPDGGIPSAYGQGLSVIWDYVAWYVIAFQDYYTHTGNAEYLKKHKATIFQSVDFLISKTESDGLINVPENPLGNIWIVTLNKATGKDSLLNSLYLRAIKTAELVARLCADRTGEEKYSGLLSRLEKQVALLLEKTPIAAKARNWKSSIMLFEIVDQMAVNGDVQGGLNLIRQKWGNLLTSGADTFYEGFWDSEAPEPIDVLQTNSPLYISYCHGWTSLPVYYLVTRVAGITALEPGMKRVLVKPELGDLTQLRVVVPIGDDALVLSIKNNLAQLYVPEGCLAFFIWEENEHKCVPGTNEFLLTSSV